MIYARLLVVLVALAALGFTHFKAYEKGKDSVIKGVLAGAATTAKEEEKRTAEAVQQTTVDTSKVTKLEKEKNDLKKRLDAIAQANPRIECVMQPGELRALQDLAGETEPQP